MRTRARHRPGSAMGTTCSPSSYVSKIGDVLYIILIGSKSSTGAKITVSIGSKNNGSSCIVYTVSATQLRVTVRYPWVVIPIQLQKFIVQYRRIHALYLSSHSNCGGKCIVLGIVKSNFSSINALCLLNFVGIPMILNLRDSRTWFLLSWFIASNSFSWSHLRFPGVFLIFSNICWDIQQNVSLAMHAQ